MGKLIPPPTFEEEIPLWQKYKFVIGLDEVGRGAFAGPLVACGVVFKPFSQALEGVHDSKLLTPAKRYELAGQIKKQVLAFAFSEISVPEINTIGIGKANRLAFQKVIQALFGGRDKKDVFVLLDGLPMSFPDVAERQQKAIIKGDQKSISIAAASILAKVKRDEIMTELDNAFSLYGFAKNKGYGTLSHRQALKLHGLSSFHRVAFCTKSLTHTTS